MDAPLLEALHTDAISRSSIWRLLQDVDLKPHKSAYWLNSHDAHFDTKAQTICQLYAKALESYKHGRLVMCCDEKTGRQVLERKAPTKPAQPGRRERREHEYIRHGTRVLINSLAVATGQLAWTIGATRKTPDCVGHLKQAYQSLPRMQCYDWVMDNLNTHWSLDVCRLVARWCHVPCEPHKLKKGVQRRAFLVIQAIVMSFISPRNTARGSIRPHCSLGSCTVAFWPVGVFPASRTLNAAWSAFYKTTMPVMLILSRRK